MSRKSWPYTRMELNSPGIRAPLDWRRIMDTVESYDAALETLSLESRAREAEAYERGKAEGIEAAALALEQLEDDCLDGYSKEGLVERIRALAKPPTRCPVVFAPVRPGDREPYCVLPVGHAGAHQTTMTASTPMTSEPTAVDDAKRPTFAESFVAWDKGAPLPNTSHEFGPAEPVRGATRQERQLAKTRAAVDAGYPHADPDPNAPSKRKLKPERGAACGYMLSAGCVLPAGHGGAHSMTPSVRGATERAGGGGVEPCGKCSQLIRFGSCECWPAPPTRGTGKAAR